jgi:hypothetical protein
LYYTLQQSVYIVLSVFKLDAMKKNILYLLLLTIFAWEGATAQSSVTGSRLNMTAKKKTAPTGNLKQLGVPANLQYKPLSLKNQTTLSAFYRTFLFSNLTPSETTFALAEADEKTVEKYKPSVETAPHSEEQLYSSDKITISNIYPNPANDVAELDYTMSSNLREARLIIYNVLGSQMNEIPLSRTERKIRVDTREMPTGLYFYQLSVDGKKVATKKMLVRHQQ